MYIPGKISLFFHHNGPDSTANLFYFVEKVTNVFVKGEAFSL